MITNELKNDIIEKKELTTWEQRKFEKMNNNFLEAIKRREMKGEILMKDLATVDRIEGDYAVCELLDGSMVNIPVKDFKEKVSEGDIFDLEVKPVGGKLSYNVEKKNIEEMEIRRQKILEKLNKINNKSYPPGIN